MCFALRHRAKLQWLKDLVFNDFRWRYASQDSYLFFVYLECIVVKRFIGQVVLCFHSSVHIPQNPQEITVCYDWKSTELIAEVFHNPNWLTDNVRANITEEAFATKSLTRKLPSHCPSNFFLLRTLETDHTLRLFPVSSISFHYQVPSWIDFWKAFYSPINLKIHCFRYTCCLHYILEESVKNSIRTL